MEGVRRADFVFRTTTIFTRRKKADFNNYYNICKNEANMIKLIRNPHIRNEKNTKQKIQKYEHISCSLLEKSAQAFM